MGGEKRTPGNYCLCMRVIYQTSGKIGYSCNLPCNDDVTSCSGVAVSAKMASCMASTTVDRSVTQAVSYALRKLGKPQLSLKEEQRSSIKAIYEGKNVFVWLPTGYGKSLCYQALPFVMDHKNGLAGTRESSAVLVITPLIALTFDQVQSLKSNGVKSNIISSGSGISRDVLGTESSLCSESILFCTPESLIRSKWRNAVENPKVSERIVAIVVDEAHCISKW